MFPENVVQAEYFHSTASSDKHLTNWGSKWYGDADIRQLLVHKQYTNSACCLVSSTIISSHTFSNSTPLPLPSWLLAYSFLTELAVIVL